MDIDLAKKDLFTALDQAPDFAPALRLAIIEGRIDPLWPNISIAMKRGCLKAHLNLKTIRSPIEVCTYTVNLGETPETSPILKNVLDWLDEWSGQDFEFSEDEGVEF